MQTFYDTQTLAYEKKRPRNIFYPGAIFCGRKKILTEEAGEAIISFILIPHDPDPLLLIGPAKK